jgi:hypothetical protein
MTVTATAVLDAHAQTHYPAVMFRLATIIFRAYANIGHDAFLALGRP